MFALAATTGRAAAFVAPRVGARAFSGSAMDMANPKVFVSFVLALLACLPSCLLPSHRPRVLIVCTHVVGTLTSYVVNPSSHLQRHFVSLSHTPYTHLSLTWKLVEKTSAVLPLSFVPTSLPKPVRISEPFALARRVSATREATSTALSPSCKSVGRRYAMRVVCFVEM